MNTKLKRVLSLVLTVMILALNLGALPALAADPPTPGYFASMAEFIAAAQALDPGSAVAHKIVTPVGTAGDFDIDLYVAGRNMDPKARGIDLVFVIDVSGSMSSDDIENARNSFISSVTALFSSTDDTAARSKVALVTFNSGSMTADFGGGRNWTTKDTWAIDQTNLTTINNGNLWATANNTATQLGIHAAHNLLYNARPATPPTDENPANGQAMIIMTDGGPNLVYTGTRNSTELSGTTGRLMEYTQAQTWGDGGNFSDNTGTGGTGADALASADGNIGSIAPTIAQAAAAREDNISVYSIGYGSKFGVPGSVAAQVLQGMGTFYLAPDQGAVLTDIMSNLTSGATIRLNNVQVVDLIGSGFALVENSMTNPQYVTGLNDIDFDVTGKTWIDVPSSSNTASVANSKVTWQFPTVDNGILYKLSFKIKINTTAPGTYHTNTNIAEEFVETGDTTPNYQTGGHNKLTYTVDGSSGGQQAIPACEKYTIVPKSLLSVDKQVTVWNSETGALDEDFEKQQTVFVDGENDAIDFVYRIVITNTGTADGTFTFKDEHFLNGAGATELVFTDFYTDVLCTVKVAADATLTVPMGGALTLYYKVTLKPGEYSRNVVTIAPGSEDDEVGDGSSESECDVYERNNIIIGVDKTVSWGNRDTAITNNNWLKYIANNNSTSETFTYKIVVSRKDKNDIPAQVKLSDIYKGAALNLGLLFDAQTNDFVDTAIDGYDVLLFDYSNTEYVFYYTVTEGRGTYVNRAIISDGKVLEQAQRRGVDNTIKITLRPSYSEATAVISNSPYIPPTSYSYNVVHRYYTVTGSNRKLDGFTDSGTITTYSSSINADTVATRVPTYGSAPYDFEAVSHTGTVSLVNGHVTITLDYVRTVIDDETPPLTENPDNSNPDEEIPIEDTKPPLTDIPSTGDNSISALYIALSLAFGGALTAALIFGRKIKKSNDKK